MMILKNKIFRSYLIFFLTVFIIFSVFNFFKLSYSDSIIILLGLTCIYFLKTNYDIKFKLNKKILELTSSKKNHEELNIEDKLNTITKKLEDMTTFNQTKSSTDFPLVNMSIISSFDKIETYIIDDSFNTSIQSKHMLLKRISSLLEKNGQKVRKLKPFNASVYKKISSSASSNDDYLNINFPSNLINSN
tara:strand:- start:1968 stop:2537 length:570 start_codon:yes stop_codon:yes gene_type:complete